MTRTYVHMKAVREAFSDVTGRIDGLERSEFEAVDADPLLRGAMRIVRALAYEAQRFNTVFLRVTGHAIADQIIIPAEDPSEVYVFPNLKLAYFSFEEARVVNPYMYGLDLLAPTISAIRSDREDAKKAQSWAPLSRGLRRLKTRRKTTIARLLTAMSKEKGWGYSDHTIRSVAADIRSTFEPLNLVEALTPEDFYTMYRTGPQSCMTVDENSGAWSRIGRNHGIWGPSWFAYHPYVKGIYAVKEGAVASRCLAYQQENGEWHYGRCYSRSGDLAQFHDALAQAGYKPLVDGLFDRPCEFEIPAYKSDRGEAYCPAPYFDNLNSRIECNYDPVRSVFRFTLRRSNANSIHNFGGTTDCYVPATQYSSVRCAHCGARHEPNDRRRYGDDFYCSTDCARARGLVSVLRTNGTLMLAPSEGAVRDALCSDVWYEHERAAESHAMRYEPHAPYAFSEDPLYTAYGETIYINGVGRRVSRATYQAIGTQYPTVREQPNNLFTVARQSSMTYDPQDVFMSAVIPPPTDDFVALCAADPVTRRGFTVFDMATYVDVVPYLEDSAGLVRQVDNVEVRSAA